MQGDWAGNWLKRFNARGLPALEEDVRSGRPPTYAAELRSAVINAALTRPTDLGLPFACWTLDRLVAWLSHQGIAMRRSRISEIFTLTDERRTTGQLGRLPERRRGLDRSCGRAGLRRPRQPEHS